MRGFVIFLFLFLALSLPARPAGGGGEPLDPQVLEAGNYDYPMPPDNDRTLFYLQRTLNSNTVVYEANLRPDGSLDPKEPVRVYWIRYNSDGSKKPLKPIERMMVYGVNSRKNSGSPRSYNISLVSMKKMVLKVYIDDRGRPRASIDIDGRPIRLRSVFVVLAKSLLLNKVEHVELYGEDIRSGAPVVRKLVP